MLVGAPANFPVCPCVKTALPINTDSEFESRSERGVQHYVINFVSDLRQVGGFLRVLRFPPPIKLTATI
jgi:hypothetical protein